MINGLDGFSWLSFNWFRLETLRSFTWAFPDIFYLLFAIPIVFAIKWIIRSKVGEKLTIALPEKAVKTSFISLLRFIPDLLLTLVMILIIVALARPQSSNEEVEQWSEGIDISLVIDISESMQIEDFRPNRLEAAKNVARDFVKGRTHDRIGIVIFAGDAFSLSPLTNDYEMLLAYLKDISFDMIQNRGTAIGSALAVATNRMRESETKSKVMILLSDGDNTAGNLDPITAAELAHAYGIKIYTIAIGREGRVPFGKDYLGRTRYFDNTLDETTLRTIAKIGEGQFFRVANNQALEEVFKRIDTYEKAEIKETRYRDTTDFYPIYLKWALAFFLIGLLLKSTFISNILED